MDLKELKGLKPEEINQLSQNWIRTTEEFASICLNEDLSENLQQLLNVNINRYNEIVNLVLSSIPQIQLNQIKNFKNIQNKAGAKKPLK